MQITSRGRYGLKAMLALSKHAIGNNNLLLTTKEIATSQNIPIKYLERIIFLLKKSDLIYSVRGSMGGYQLSRAPNLITVYQVVTALEKNFSITSHKDNLTSKNNLTFWDELDTLIKDALSIPLSEFIKKEENENVKFMYYI